METVVMIVLGIIVGAYVLVPLVASRPAVAYDWDGSGSNMLRDERRTEIEADVDTYRQAIRAGTLCTRCGLANSEGSRFCAECGRPLPGATKPEAEPEPVSG
jgi:hypothetical protein